MKRVALWVALAHGLVIAALLQAVQQRVETPPRPLLIQLQLQSSVAQVSAAKLAAPSKRTMETAAPQPPALTAAPTASDSLATPSPPPAAPPAAVPAVPSIASRAERLTTIEATCAGNPKPAYSPITRRLGEQGVAMLRVQIGADGRVSDVLLAKTSGYPRLDRIALETVREWRCEPPKKGGLSVSAWYELRVEFRLEN